MLNTQQDNKHCSINNGGSQVEIRSNSKEVKLVSSHAGTKSSAVFNRSK